MSPSFVDSSLAAREVRQAPVKIPWSWGSKIVDQYRRDRLVETAHLFTGAVLDVGCGRKPYRQLLGNHARRWIGVDFRATASGASHADVFGSGLHLPFAGAAFDVVLCTEVLEHVSEPDALIAEIARVLRPGGVLILTAPQSHGLHEEPSDYFRFTRYGLMHLATKHGFAVERIAPLGGVLALVGQTVAHHTPMLLPGGAGRLSRGAAQAMVQFVFWHADKLLHRFHDGADESTLDNILVAHKPR